MAPGAGRHDEGSSDTAIQLSPRRRRAVKGTWPRRSPERGQSDRLFLSQARQLQILAGLVRARAESRSEPCTDVAVLRPVAKLSRATAIRRKKMRKGRASLPGLSFSFE